ncbi:hypothetical protein Tco_0290538 [Tanacetum coccineum]
MWSQAAVAANFNPNPHANSQNIFIRGIITSIKTEGKHFHPGQIYRNLRLINQLAHQGPAPQSQDEVTKDHASFALIKDRAPERRRPELLLFKFRLDPVRGTILLLEKGDDKLPVIIANDLKDEDIKGKLFQGYTVYLRKEYDPHHKDENEYIPIELVTVIGEKLCFDYRKILMKPTEKKIFPLPFMDQVLEKTSRENEYILLPRWFSGYFQFLLTQKIKIKDNIHIASIRNICLSSLAFWAMHAPGTFQRCMMAIFQI